MQNELKKQQALEYHAKGRPGKIEVVPTKEAKTQRDLSLAYSPGVAEPCMEIYRNPEDVYKYTAKGNLVAVISNGTAVLGLGNIGPEAGKPVMEGKGVLFKIFADIDVFDIEINETDPVKFCQIVKALEPTFGGINLEDIKAPECFYIERTLKKEMNIPIMHDDQHGTAIISAAALLNALEIQEKDIAQIKIVINGAGAAGMSLTQLYIALGAQYQNVTMFDKDGVLHSDRTDLDEVKQKFAVDPSLANITLADAMKDADVFVGVSVGNVVTQDMVKSMADKPIIFAMANPNPEITYDLATAVRPDLIMATGRTDYPNQVNNVLGFPYIFRGALDVRATTINEEMKLAAVHALAELTKQPVPDLVNLAYNEKNITFGPSYIIPKPLDPRLLATVAPAVAKAAIDSGVARKEIADWEAYKLELNKRLGLDNQLLRAIGQKARKDPRHVVFADAENLKVLKAARICLDEGICYPVLLGDEKIITELAEKNIIVISDMPIIDPKSDKVKGKREEYAEIFFNKNGRKGYNLYEANRLMKDRTHFGLMMVETDEVDAILTGPSKDYPKLIKPVINIVGTEKGVNKYAGMYIIETKRGPIFLADATINYNPNAEELADITLLVANEIQNFNIKPKIAMLSYSNFGSSNGAEAKLVANARKIVKQKRPDLIVDGDIQGIMAFNNELLKENYPFSELIDQNVNTLIFPNLAAGNIAYNLLKELGNMDAIGPVLLGSKKAVQVLQLGSQIRQIVNMALVAVLDAQMKNPKTKSECEYRKESWYYQK